MRKTKKKGRIVLVLLSIVLIASFACAGVDVKTFTAHQVRPGDSFDLLVSVANLDAAQVEYSTDGSASIASTSNGITLNSIEVQDPFSGIISSPPIVFRSWYRRSGQRVECRKNEVT